MWPEPGVLLDLLKNPLESIAAPGLMILGIALGIYLVIGCQPDPEPSSQSTDETVQMSCKGSRRNNFRFSVWPDRVVPLRK